MIVSKNIIALSLCLLMAVPAQAGKYTNMLLTSLAISSGAPASDSSRYQVSLNQLPVNTGIREHIVKSIEYCDGGSLVLVSSEPLPSYYCSNLKRVCHYDYYNHENGRVAGILETCLNWKKGRIAQLFFGPSDGEQFAEVQQAMFNDTEEDNDHHTNSLEMVWPEPEPEIENINDADVACREVNNLFLNISKKKLAISGGFKDDLRMAKTICNVREKIMISHHGELPQAVEHDMRKGDEVFLESWNITKKQYRAEIERLKKQ